MHHSPSSPAAPPHPRHGHPPGAGVAAADDRRPWTLLVLLALAQFMVVLDVTVVNVALPSIGSALRFAPGQLQWVVTAYVLATGGLMLLGGRLGDHAGRRRVLLAGLATFTAASTASGLAWSPAALVVARAAQGVGAAMLLPSALALVTTAYSGRQRTVALAVWGALGSAGAAAGVLAGGVLTTALGWRGVFFVNVPVGLAVAALLPHVTRALPPAPRERRGLDVAGAAGLTAGLATLLLAVEGAGQHGWTSARTLLLAATAAALLLGFLAAERRADHPLVPASTWRNRPLVSGAGVMLATTGILVGAFFLNTLLLQQAMGWSPITTGLGFLPLTLVILAGAHLAQHVLPRAGTRAPMAAGLLLTAAGALLLSRVPAGASYAADLLPGFLVLGLGTGMTFVSVSVAAMAGVHDRDAGLESGLMTTAHELGAALGVAVLAAIEAAGSGVADGYRDAFLVAGAVAVALALVTALALPSVRPRPGMAHGLH